jgi:hypothetical protein
MGGVPSAMGHVVVPELSSTESGSGATCKHLGPGRYVSVINDNH